jgi:hypothetical protein
VNQDSVPQERDGPRTLWRTSSINCTSDFARKLVFLDVTVLDKKGRPVVSGLTKDDFTIAEDKIPQTIFSFEAPEAHVMGAGAEGENPKGKAPKAILEGTTHTDGVSYGTAGRSVMDLLNSSWEDFSYIRYEVQRFLHP